MHPDVVAMWAKTEGLGHMCTLDSCLAFFFKFAGLKCHVNCMLDIIC